MTEFNKAKFLECETEHGHEWGYNADAGNCTYCGLIHNCEVDDKYEFDGDNFICSVCHIFPSQEVLKDIERANQDARDADLEYRSILL